MVLSALKNLFKGSSCGCKKYTKRSTRKRKSRKNYRGGHTYSKNTFQKSTIRLSSPSKFNKKNK